MKGLAENLRLYETQRRPEMDRGPNIATVLPPHLKPHSLSIFLQRFCSSGLRGGFPFHIFGCNQHSSPHNRNPICNFEVHYRLANATSRDAEHACPQDLDLSYVVIISEVVLLFEQGLCQQILAGGVPGVSPNITLCLVQVPAALRFKKWKKRLSMCIQRRVGYTYRIRASTAPRSRFWQEHTWHHPYFCQAFSLEKPHHVMGDASC